MPYILSTLAYLRKSKEVSAAATECMKERV
jgi:hypothetical protein